MQIIVEQKKNALISLSPVCTLKSSVGGIPVGDLYYIPEFRDGQVYVREETT